MPDYEIFVKLSMTYANKIYTVTYTQNYIKAYSYDGSIYYELHTTI